MDFRTFWNSNFAFVLKMLLLAVVVVVGIVIAANYWLRDYTHHGEEVVVPDVTGMYVEEARVHLSSCELGMQVVDSTYNSAVPLGTIIEQNPPAMASTKAGRAVYVVMNSRMVPTVSIPDLHDISYRQAEATLRSLGIEVSEVIYQPSEYNGLVLDVTLNDEPIQPQQKLPIGSTVVLVVGQNAESEETVYVPQLHGMTLEDARRTILKNSLVVGAINQEAQTDKEQYVYHQQPEAGKWVQLGSSVTLYLSTDTNKHIEQQNTEEDFF